MPGVEITISGVLFDKVNRTQQNVVLIGEATLTGLGIGGGPILPPSGGPPGAPGVPAHPIYTPPGIWGPTDPRPTPPIVIPVPPGAPNVPPPGSPPVAISGTQPTNPMVPPAAVVIDYPGVGKVVVPQPTQTVPGPSPA